MAQGALGAAGVRHVGYELEVGHSRRAGYIVLSRTQLVCSLFREYYFSEENLQRDFFLRRKMDKDGWIPVSLIASFHRVQQVTRDVHFILEVETFSLQFEIYSFFFFIYNCNDHLVISAVQCFDTVGRATRRASGL